MVTIGTFDRIRFFFTGLLNSIFPEPSSQQLLEEQVGSYQRALSNSARMLEKSGGNLKVAERDLAKAKKELQREQMNLQQAISSGAKPEKVATHLRMVKLKEQHVQILENGIAKGAETQERGKAAWQQLSSQRDIAHAEASVSISEETLADMLLEIAHAQLAAQGAIEGAEIKDYRDVIGDRAAQKMGEAETAMDLAGQAFGEQEKAEEGSQIFLTQDEMEYLSSAYQQQGKQVPEDFQSVGRMTEGAEG